MHFNSVVITTLDVPTVEVFAATANSSSFLDTAESIYQRHPCQVLPRWLVAKAHKK